MRIFSSVLGISFTMMTLGSSTFSLAAIATQFDPAAEKLGQHCLTNQAAAVTHLECTLSNADRNTQQSQFSQNAVMNLPEGTLIFSQTPEIAVRVYNRDGQLRMNLYNKATNVTELRDAAVTVEAIGRETVYRYAGQRTVAVAVADSGAQTIAIDGVTLNGYSTVTGAVSYLPRIALSPDAVMVVELMDASQVDGSDVHLASQQIQTGGRQVPLPFELVYDPAQIDPNRSYVLQARILEEGQLRFATTSRVPVITQGNPTQVSIQVDLVDEANRSDSTSLTDTVWQLQSIQTDDGTPLIATSPSQYTIEFMEDGQLSIRADCNQVLGNFTADEGRLSLALGATTLAACRPDSIDQSYLQALRSVAAYTLSDQTLVLELSDDMGTMQFTAAPETPER